MAKKLHLTKTTIKKTPSRITRRVVRVSGITLLLLALAAGIFLPGSKPESLGGRGRSRVGKINESLQMTVTEPVATSVPEIIETVATIVPEETALPNEDEAEWFSSRFNFTMLNEVCYSKPSEWLWWVTEEEKDCFGSKNVTPITLETKDLPVGMKVLATGSKIPSGDVKIVSDGKVIEAPADGEVTICKTQQTLDRIEGKLNMSYSIFKVGEDGYTFTGGNVTGECYTVANWKEIELTRGLIWEALSQNPPKGWALTNLHFTITFNTALTANWFGEQAFSGHP